MTRKCPWLLMGCAIGAALAAAVTAAALAGEAEPSGFVLTSTTFKDGGMLPTRTGFTKSAEHPNCVGENLSPQLSWSNPPAAAKSFVLTMVDQEGTGGLGDFDLVVYGIPPAVSSFAEGELSKPSPRYVGGTNAWGLHGWRGMCPPPGTALHHYVIKVIATDLDPKALQPGLTLPELQTRLKGHTMQASALVGRFVRPH
jgi:Raf kinase inhibitor-like YbhB/YbcL family protein